MSIGTSIFLIAVGAILEFAVTVENPRGVDLNTIGVILMIVGAIGAQALGYYVMRRITNIKV